MTTLQARTLHYIRWHWWRYGQAPTSEELAAGFEVKESSMDTRLRKMERQGMIERHRRLGIVPCK